MKHFHVKLNSWANEPSWYVMSHENIVIARCFSAEDADQVAVALNRMEADQNRGKS